MIAFGIYLMLAGFEIGVLLYTGLMSVPDFIGAPHSTSERVYATSAGLIVVTQAGLLTWMGYIVFLRLL